MNKHHQNNYIVLFTVTCDLTTKANGERMAHIYESSVTFGFCYLHSYISLLFLNQTDQRFIFCIDLLCPLTYDVQLIFLLQHNTHLVPYCGNVSFVYVC